MAPDAVNSIYSFIVCSVILCMLMLVSLLGTFLVHSLPTLVLFDLGASQYFIP